MTLAQCISYPKSGRTWLRYMLQILNADSAIAFGHDGFEFNDGSRPPHTFDLATPLAHYSGDAKIIYLDRDPRDVMVSHFHQVTGRFQDFFEYKGDLSAFIRDDYFGAQVLAQFREMWRAILAERSFLQLSYEEMHADPAGALRSALAYLEITRDESAIAAAVEAGRLESMRKLEASGQHP